MKASIENGKLIVTIETSTPTPSASGKTLVVASSHGNVPTEALIDGKPVTVGFNATIATNGKKPYAKTGEKCAKITGKDLIVSLPLQTASLSSTGKTMIIASTHGFITTDAKVADKNVVIAVTAYYSNN